MVSFAMETVLVSLSNTLQPEVLPVRKMLMLYCTSGFIILYKYWQGNYVGELEILIETHKK